MEVTNPSYEEGLMIQHDVYKYQVTFWDEDGKLVPSVLAVYKGSKLVGKKAPDEVIEAAIGYMVKDIRD